MSCLKSVVSGVVTASLLLMSTVTVAATQLYTQVTVYTILTEEGKYGGCMAKTDLTNFAGDGLSGCPDQWVTLDCEGNYGSKSIGLSKYSSAQLAYVTGRKLNLVVDDSKDRSVSNNYCWAARVDNAP